MESKYQAFDTDLAPFKSKVFGILEMNFIGYVNEHVSLYDEYYFLS